MGTLKRKIIFAEILSESISLLLLMVVGLLLSNLPVILGRLATIYLTLGFAAVVMFNILRHGKVLYFFITWIALSLIIARSLYNAPTTLSFIHHTLALALLGVFIYFLNQIIQRKELKSQNLSVIFLWILLFILFFGITRITNGLIFKYRHNVDNIDFFRMALRTLKHGLILGLGVGLGFYISSYFKPR